MLLAIDPGSEESGWCMIGEKLRPEKSGKAQNRDLLHGIYTCGEISRCVIERIESYGLGVGRTVFDTCIWTGRFVEACAKRDIPVWLLPRREVKLHLCGRMSAKDANIVAALRERFGDKGTKREPGWFYGFKGDIWQAYALGVTWIEQEREE